MKKIFKMLLYFFLTIMGLLICLVVFLRIFYSVLEKQQTKKDRILSEKFLNIPAVDSNISSSKSQLLNLIPVPKKVQFTGGNFVFPRTLLYSVADSLGSGTEEYLGMIPGLKAVFSPNNANLIFRYKKLPVQGYNLDIRPGKIISEYSTRQGLYYSLVTLKVLKQNYNGNLPCVHIEDYPDLSVRGLMLDISRDKVPSLETLKGITQLLADLKFNHLELYIEGFSFAYPSFKSLWDGKETPVTAEEIKDLDVFCKARFIDLVPNQNSLGHMMAWLATDQYKDLAECPKGYKILGLMNMKSTLDPNDPRSIELVSKMTDDLLPNFTSSNFNVNLDEPFELGKGKSKEVCEKKGVGEVYLEYAMKLHKITTDKNKKMLMWGDIILRHPDLLPLIPKDITLLDWGYESGYPYEKHCKVLQASGLKYMVCPGTNSWTAITGRTDNMIATIGSATANASKYGAEGMLLTDWGDMGHWQYLPVSYAGYVTGGGLSWNAGSRETMPLSAFLNSYVFRDANSVMGDLALDLGRYNRFEEIPVPNMTTTVMSLQFGLRDEIMVNAIFDKVKNGITDLMKDLAPEMITTFIDNYDKRHPYDYQGMKNFIDSKEALLHKVKLQSSDSSIIKDEYFNAIRLIRLGTGLQSYIHFRRNLSPGEEHTQLEMLHDLGKKYLEENHRLWLLRNKPGGYDRSTAVLNKLLMQIDDRMKMLDKSPFARGFNRFLEKIGTAGAVLYLRLS